MKKLFLVFALVLSAATSKAALKESDLNLLVGSGLFGSRGIMGFSLDRMFTEHHAVTAAFGADFTGASSMAGYKYFSSKANEGNTWKEKCLFLFDCDIYYYGGGGAQYAGGTTVTFTESTGDKREYQTDPKWFGMANVGVRDVYKNGLTVDFELTYRDLIAGGDYHQTQGTADASDDKHIKMGYRGVGFGIAMGYMF